MGYGYSLQLDEKAAEKVARASGRDIPVKPKFAVEVVRSIKGRSVANAKKYLADVIALKAAVPFRKTRRHIKHQKGVGPGKFPVNVAKAVLKVLENAEANAEYKGLEPEDMVVFHACAHRASPIPGMMPRAYGRATQWNKTTSHIEIMIREKGTDGESSSAKADAKESSAKAESKESSKAPKAAPKAAPKVESKAAAPAKEPAAKDAAPEAAPVKEVPKEES